MCAGHYRTPRERSYNVGYRCFLFYVFYTVHIFYIYKYIHAAAAFHHLHRLQVSTTLQRLIRHYNNAVKTIYTCTRRMCTALLMASTTGEFTGARVVVVVCTNYFFGNKTLRDILPAFNHIPSVDQVR